MPRDGALGHPSQDNGPQRAHGGPESSDGLEQSHTNAAWRAGASAVEGRLYGPQAAIGSLITLPVVILGMCIQKHLITGFSFGMLRK